MVCAGDIYYHIHTRTLPDYVTARLNFRIHLGKAAGIPGISMPG
jgi:hypothetical protein